MVESGLAAYFPCSFNDRANFGEESAVLLRQTMQQILPDIWTLENERKLSELKMNSSPGPILDGIQIWGGVFWAIRQALGKATTDKLLYDTWISLTAADLQSKEPVMFAKKLIDKDEEISKGKYVNQIKAILKQRGLEL